MKIIIERVPLKVLLTLFNPTDKIRIQELGDTGHPTSGFVDQSIISHINTVGKLLDFNYDFKGLVLFDAIIDSIHLYYTKEGYTISGPIKALKKVETSIIESNAIDPVFTYIVEHF